jgi:hypothetical protein
MVDTDHLGCWLHNTTVMGSAAAQSWKPTNITIMLMHACQTDCTSTKHHLAHLKLAWVLHPTRPLAVKSTGDESQPANALEPINRHVWVPLLSKPDCRWCRHSRKYISFQIMPTVAAGHAATEKGWAQVIAYIHVRVSPNKLTTLSRNYSLLCPSWCLTPHATAVLY